MLSTWELTYELYKEEVKKEFTSEYAMQTHWSELEQQYEGYDENYLKFVSEKEKEIPNDQIVFINVYTIERCYGGPEEGGWWYNAYECVEVLPVQYQHAYTLRDEMQKRYEGSHKWGDIYSVLGGQDVWVGVEIHPKQSETTERPIYE